MTKETAIEILEGQKNEHYKEEINEALDMAISALKGFEGMTNGEVLKLIFPTAELLLGNSDYIPNVLSVKEDWWNAPYKGVSE